MAPSCGGMTLSQFGSGPGFCIRAAAQIYPAPSGAPVLVMALLPLIEKVQAGVWGPSAPEVMATLLSVPLFLASPYSLDSHCGMLVPN